MSLLVDNKSAFVRSLIGMLYMRTLFLVCYVHAPMHFFDVPFPETPMTQALHCCMRAYGTLQGLANRQKYACGVYKDKTQQCSKELMRLLSVVHAFKCDDSSIKLDDLEYLLGLLERMETIVLKGCGDSLRDIKCDILLRIITKNVELICLNIQYSQNDVIAF